MIHLEPVLIWECEGCGAFAEEFGEVEHSPLCERFDDRNRIVQVQAERATAALLLLDGWMEAK